jgi:hypothetical protein
MLKNFSKGLLLLGALTIATSAVAQLGPGKDPHAATIDLAGTVIFEHAQVAQLNGNRFWPKGGGVNVAFTAWKGFGLAADVSGEHASNIQNGVGLSKIAFMAGPRFTFNITHPGEGFSHDRGVRAFVQGLYGPTHAFDSLFPGPTSVETSATALSVKAGGGVDIPWKNGFGIRAIEVGWIHSDYSNSAADIQNDFRIGFGVSYRR